MEGIVVHNNETVIYYCLIKAVPLCFLVICTGLLILFKSPLCDPTVDKRVSAPFKFQPNDLNA